MKRIGEFEVVDHGVEHSQYFQGCGTFGTGFQNVVTGVGDTPADAIDDCLEQIAQDDFETEGVEGRILAEFGLAAMPTTPVVSEKYPDSDDVYYHVSIRWNEA